jgi:hypothetical protein
MKPILIIKALAVALIAFFTLGTLGASYAIFTGGFSLLLLFAAATNIGFVIAGIGLFRVRRWSWWLTLGLCAVSIIQLLWQIFTKLTPETATNQNQMVSYIVAGFYLAIGFALTSDSVRKTFREYDPAA